ncbi:CBS domain-containing protein [Aquifex aeolicus]|uniref:Cyclic nucleotide binding protein n=1 Tax=Aquifex aeolicus (strain VF5) TaxID=224324 RepID=O67874_AQUAE|nr:cyclic nucleotide-binding/CBS domain-containing protein [Aquifex aeolicus]AAC07845.1 hypothetical protein aq_2107 [Aquifex aeolicus VF5]
MIVDVKEFLQTHYPFSSLPPSSLENLSKVIKVKYYPKGSEIFKKDEKPLEYLYVIRKGNVSLRSDGVEIDFLSEGDSFGFISLITDSPPSSTAVAETDVILYLIPKEVFKQLMEKYPEFRNYFTTSLAKRIAHTAERVKENGGAKTFEKFLTVQVKDLKLRKVPFILPSESVYEAVKKMVEDNSSCAIVKSEDEEGIITERDVLKKVIYRDLNPKEVKVKEVMTSPLISVEPTDFLFDVLLTMSKNNIRRVVVKEDGNILGVLEDKDIIALETQNLIVIVKEVEKAKSVEELSYLYSLVDDMAVNLFNEGVKPEVISRLISEINDKFISKAIQLAIKELGLEPIVSFSFMVLGSEGRKEQTLKTDQDNALIYDDTYPSLDVDLEDYFKKFGEKISEILLKIGFPPCPSNVMVRNPEWNKGKTEWLKTLEKWFSKPDPENTLKLGIFLDFRNVFGDKTLEEELRKKVFELAKENELLIAYMFKDTVRFKPPLGLFGRLKVEKEGIDIKKGGIFPITSGIRTLAIKNEIAETNTLDRMKKLYEKGVLYKELYENLKEAFNYLQYIRLKSQIEKLKEGKQPDNYVNPERLSKLELDLLKDAFKVVAQFQEFIETKYLTYIPS